MEGILSERILITEEQLQGRVAELAKQISEDYKGKEILLVGILTGCIPFLADLMRDIDESVNVSIDTMCVSSYKGTESTGTVKITKDLKSDIAGKHVLIVEDIIDTGITLESLKRLLHTRNPASLKIATALSKPSRRKINVDVDYVGFEIPDEFVIGYGLDYEEYGRNFRCIKAIEVAPRGKDIAPDNKALSYTNAGKTTREIIGGRF